MIPSIMASYVAILVPSVRKASQFLCRFNFLIGEEELWDSEGTREVYIERDKANSLLLMEPTKPGAYQRALEKRGPGLHHLAIDVLDLENFLDSLTGSGWLLHPKSIKTIKQVKTAYLARPGFPGLIEVQQKESFIQEKLFVENIRLPFDPIFIPMLKKIGLNGVVVPTVGISEIVLGGQLIKMEELF